jgi:hypothetical protein
MKYRWNMIWLVNMWFIRNWLKWHIVEHTEKGSNLLLRPWEYKV